LSSLSVLIKIATATHKLKQTIDEVMSKSPNNTVALPHENKDTLYLTDSGLETQLIFKDNFTLPGFAAFTMLYDSRGSEHCKEYYRRHAALAAQSSNSTKLGFVFESMTWRATPDWLKKLGYDNMQDIADKAIRILAEVRDEFPSLASNGVLSGNVGPRGDGYVASDVMTPNEAKEYHYPLILALKNAGADMVMAATLNYIDEGIGIVLAAQKAGIPVVLSFTLETDGCLLTGEPMSEIIHTIDETTDNGPAYYMINCAHPTHFIGKLNPKDGDREWISRIGGIRGNASKMSHAELDDALELDEGNPKEFGKDNLSLLELLPQANVFGGCCGTDIRHVESILSSCPPAFEARKQKQLVQ
jgi:S-methylmethionine-dependent homocysteine/selenocysteine methylase